MEVAQEFSPVATGEKEKERREPAAMAHGNPVPKFYKSVMDDVIEGVRDVFMEEGVDEQVLKELKRRWESKVMQSKATEGFFRHSHIAPQFTLHLPPNFHQTLQTSTGATAGRGIRQFTTSTATTSSSSAAAVEPAAELGSSRAGSAILTLPSGLTYPIQIPAGVTLQTASGHLYKVNMPVVVTQAPGNGSGVQNSVPQIFQQPGKEPSGSQSTIEGPGQGNTSSLQAASNENSQVKSAVPQQIGMEEKALLAVDVMQEGLGSQGKTPVEVPVSSQPCSSLETPRNPEVTRATTVPKLPESDNTAATTEAMGVSPSVGSELSANLHQTLDPDDIIELIIMGNELNDSTFLPNEANLSFPEEMEPDLQAPKDMANDLKTIIQLDGTGDAFPRAEIESPPDGEDEELIGIIDTEDLKVLDEEEEEGENSTSDNQSLSSTSDTDDPSVDITEEVKAFDPSEKEYCVPESMDPLNSGDDVSEQETPDVFDTDNIIVCQYDKVQRSKNRWKFYLKDGVMCFGGKDYVFSKAIGDAEW
ncbi:hypothetical protein JD844_025588 [Phrynosoma platyrhinos]|uniref:TFIIA-alpha and beta-like factor n=1 Tax=Phrynosoma platyrhinos TaxID=52577 RepID=A0ABQ7T012_PHRPL|nr:hypothetical protein JD844_025588 [Phrynosoma platyrhinos]